MDPWLDVDDATLVGRARAGETAAWHTLVERHTHRLWSVARGMRLADADAADAVQTTWLRLVEHLGELREPDRIGAWLATTVRREAIRTLGRHARTVVVDSLDGVPDDGDPLDGRLLRDERDTALWRAFRMLEPRCQLLLRVLTGDPPPSYTQVAAALDMPIGSIGPTRRRCLSKLREFLAGTYPLETSAPESA